MINERRQKRLERAKIKVTAEYDEELSLLKSRSDYLQEYDYFLQLIKEPVTAELLKKRINKPLAAVLCIQAPLELFYAFDLHPVKLCSGSHTAGRVAAPSLPVLMCPMLKAFIGSRELTEDNFAAYKTVVLPTTCDWVVKLPEIMGILPDNLHYLELPHIKETEKAQTRWLEEIIALKKHLENITGKKLSVQRLYAEINKFMKIWILLNSLIELKRNGQISGIWYTLITNTFMLDDLDRWQEHLISLIDKLKALPPLPAGKQPKIFVAGSPIFFPNLKLLELIETADMHVAADDLCSSERLFPGGTVLRDTDEYGLLRALAARYHQACICPTFADNERRINNILSVAAENNIHGVIFNLLKGCHPYDIEAITIERKIKAAGLKFIKIETDYGKEDSQNILTRLEAFRQTL